MSDNTFTQKVKPDRKSKHPDVYSEPDDNGDVVIVANKKGRRVLNGQFEKPGPRWVKVRGSDYLKSPEYLSIAVECGPAPPVLLSVAHQAGLKVTFTCSECSGLHVMDDELANRFLQEARFEAFDVHPGTAVVQ